MTQQRFSTIKNNLKTQLQKIYYVDLTINTTYTLQKIILFLRFENYHFMA